MKDYVIIVAGGKGLRMGSDIPKQFLPIGGKPVLMRTIERFREYSADLQIILVLPKGQQAYWKQLCHEYDFRVDYLLADGGETRFHSVQNGLALIPDDATGVVSVHDGVRPFPAIDVIGRCYETARAAGAAIPVIPVVETLRHLSGIGQERTNFDDIGLNGQTRTACARQDGQERTNFDGIGQNGLTRTAGAGQDGQTQTEENSPCQSVQSVQSDAKDSPYQSVQSDAKNSPRQSVQSDAKDSPRQSVQSDAKESPCQSVQSDAKESPCQSVQSDAKTSPYQSVQSDAESPCLSVQSDAESPCLSVQSDAESPCLSVQSDAKNSPCQSVQSDAEKESVTVPRGDYRLVQTPQAFDIQLLKAANRQPYSDAFTDDASVVEAFGHPITLVEGNRENIKLTTPYDLKIAEVLI